MRYLVSTSIEWRVGGVKGRELSSNPESDPNPNPSYFHSHKFGSHSKQLLTVKW